MNGPTGTSAQAGADKGAQQRRVGWLVAIRSSLSRALSGRDHRLDGAGQSVGHLIARRAERVSNRKRAQADKYMAIHTILSRGVR